MLIFALGKLISHIVIFLHFHSTRKGLPLIDSWSRGLDLNQLYLDRTLRNVPPLGTHSSSDQSMVESAVTEGGKNTASFLFVNEHNNTNT